jgi:hypothetical protein
MTCPETALPGQPAGESVFVRCIIRQHLDFRLCSGTDSKERPLLSTAMILPGAHGLAAPDRVQ